MQTYTADFLADKRTIIMNYLKSVAKLCSQVWLASAFWAIAVCGTLGLGTLHAQAPNKAGEPKAMVVPVFRLFEAERGRPIATKLTKAGIYLQLRRQALDSIVKLKPHHMKVVLPKPNGQGEWVLSLEPSKVLSDDFAIKTSGGEKVDTKAILEGIFTTRGTVDQKGKSLVGLTFTSKGLMGVIATDEGTFDLGQIGGLGSAQTNRYALYETAEMQRQNPFNCGTSDDLRPPSQGGVAPNPRQNQTQTITGPYGCYRKVSQYFEVRNEIYLSMGSSIAATTALINGIFNITTDLYDRENVRVQISEIYIWTTADPFGGCNTTSCFLDLFRTTRTSFNGDLAHLITAEYGGGRAHLDALCQEAGYKHATSGIKLTYEQLPTYSWSVMVITHEMGHNLGSPHTQSCSWPVGALDNCYATEEGCVPGPAPVNGGTIMSYCHLVSSGINLLNGFGRYPGELIRRRVNGSACLQDLGTGTLSSNCLPTFPAATNTYDIGPWQVYTNTISNISGTSGSKFYEDNTCAQGTTFEAGAIYPIIVDTRTYPQNVRAWIDYNNNGTFESGELILSNNGTTAAETHAAAFTVPLTAVRGVPLVMRVMADYITNTTMAPCGTLLFGQAEDYRIMIVTAGPWTAGTLNSGNQALCNPANPNTVNLFVNPSIGVQLQWYYKDGIVAAPATTDPIGTWIPVYGQQAISFNPPNFLTTSRTYALRGQRAYQEAWATGARQITILQPLVTGALVNKIDQFESSENPTQINMSVAPSGASGAYIYQWYERPGYENAPIAGSTSGWTAVASATSPRYTPPPALQSKSYALWVAQNGSTCGADGWAANYRRITVGEFVHANDTVSTCSGKYYDTKGPNGTGEPLGRLFITPSIAGKRIKLTFTSHSFTSNAILYINQDFSQFYQRSLSGNDPQGEVFISDGTTGGYKVEMSNYGTGDWDATISCVGPRFFGTISGNQNICDGSNPAVISFALPPSNSETILYDWYYKEGYAAVPDPYSNPAGWTSTTGRTATFSPLNLPNSTRTYACYVSLNGQAQWAAGVQTVRIYPPITNGSLTAYNGAVANAAPSTLLSVGISPQGGNGDFSYQWFYRDGYQACPTGASTTGWTIIGGAVGLQYNTPAGITGNRTYACLAASTVAACGTWQWLSGCNTITVINHGTLARGSESLCTPTNGNPIEFGIAPSGARDFSYQWYNRTGEFAAPTGSSTTGWTLETAAGNTNQTFDPPAGRTSTRTYACLVTSSLITVAWAGNSRIVAVAPPVDRKSVV